MNLKNIAYEYHAINLLTNEHKSPEHLKRNPVGAVPVLFIDNTFMSQSVSLQC